MWKFRRVGGENMIKGQTVHEKQFKNQIYTKELSLHTSSSLGKWTHNVWTTVKREAKHMPRRIKFLLKNVKTTARILPSVK